MRGFEVSVSSRTNRLLDYDSKSLLLIDIETGETIQKLTGAKGSIQKAALSPNGDLAVAASSNKFLYLWNTDSGELVHTFREKGHPQEVRSIEFSANGSMVLSGGSLKTCLWSVREKKFIRRIGDPKSNNGGYSVSLSNNTAYALIINSLGLCLWDITRKSGHVIDCLPARGTERFSTVAFSPSGMRALSGGRNGSFCYWNLQTGEPIFRLEESHVGWVSSVCFSPDGRQALSGSADKTAILWDLKNGHEIRRFIGHDSGVNVVGFLDIGRKALTSDGQTVRIWALPTE